MEEPREVIAAHQNYVRMMYRCKKRHHSLVEVEYVAPWSVEEQRSTTHESWEQTINVLMCNLCRFKYRRSTPIPGREDGVKDENDKWVYTARVAWTKYCLGSALERAYRLVQGWLFALFLCPYLH